jgi:uncharacterized protein YbjQ (UPF0145 family)
MMQKYKMIVLAAAAATLFSPLVSQARDDVLHLDFQSVVDAAIADGTLDGTVKFYLKGKGGAVKKTFKEATSNKKTNAFNKTDEEACAWALRSVLLSFQENAKKNGGNAVVNLVSYYKKNEYKSTTQYECHAGAMVAGVAMKGNAAVR